MTTYLIGSVLGFVVGGAFIWFAKDKLTVMVTGTEASVASLETKAASLKAKITPAPKAPVPPKA